MNPWDINVDDREGRPLSRQIADHIRAAIISGELADGEEVPAEVTLAKKLRVSRSVIADAYALLESEGRMIRGRGKVSRVRALPPIRRLATSRYGEEQQRLRAGEHRTPVSAFVLDHGITWDEYTVQAKYEEVKAGEAAARLLQVRLGTMILRRRLIKFARKIPAELVVSCFRLSDVQGTAVADPSRQPWPGGTIAELAELGYRDLEDVVEDIKVREPNRDEAASLNLPRTEPVFEITRVFLAGGGVPVEASDTVMSAKGNTLHWRTDLRVK